MLIIKYDLIRGLRLILLIDCHSKQHSAQLYRMEQNTRIHCRRWGRWIAESFEIGCAKQCNEQQPKSNHGNGSAE